MKEGVAAAWASAIYCRACSICGSCLPARWPLWLYLSFLHLSGLVVKISVLCLERFVGLHPFIEVNSYTAIEVTPLLCLCSCSCPTQVFDFLTGVSFIRILVKKCRLHFCVCCFTFHARM